MTTTWATRALPGRSEELSSANASASASSHSAACLPCLQVEVESGSGAARVGKGGGNEDLAGKSRVVEFVQYWVRCQAACVTGWYGWYNKFRCLNVEADSAEKGTALNGNSPREMELGLPGRAGMSLSFLKTFFLRFF